MFKRIFRKAVSTVTRLRARALDSTACSTHTYTHGIRIKRGKKIEKRRNLDVVTVRILAAVGRLHVDLLDLRKT